MKKVIKYADVVIRKLELALTSATNYRLEVIRKKRRKMEEIVIAGF